MRKFLCISITVFIFTTFIFTFAGAEDFDNINFIDSESGAEYSACIYSRKTELYNEGELLIEFELDNIVSCSASGKIITLYEVDSLNKQLCLYRYNIAENMMESFAVNRNPFYDKLCFASDSLGNIYFVSNYKISCLCVYNIFDNSIKDFELNSRIRQVLNIGDNKILIITDNALYIYYNDICEKLSNFSPAYPICFEEKLKFSDSNEKIYFISDSGLQEETEVSQTEIENASNTTFQAETEHNESEYEYSVICENTYLVPKGTTVSKIKNAFASSGVSKVTKADGNIIKNGKVGTGTRVHFENGEFISLVILGELTGEGNINSRDTKALLNMLCGKETLTNSFYEAADINSDGEINTKDALEISRMYD